MPNNPPMEPLALVPVPPPQTQSAPPTPWFSAFRRREGLTHGAAYHWWGVFCAERNQALLPSQATDSDRAAFAEWLHKRRARVEACRLAQGRPRVVDAARVD